MIYQPKTVLITGASGDFGTAFAQRFAAIGCTLILHGRSEVKLDAVIDKLPEDTKVYKLVCELSDPNVIQEAITQIPDAFSNIDLLINNAGLALGAGAAQDAQLEDWLQMIQINNAALVTISHAVLKGMVSRGCGHIINIGSTAGSYPYPGGHVYCASKSFVKQFSLSLRADLYNQNIRVTNIEPGMVETQFSLVRYKGDESQADNVYASTTPLQAEDVAESVFWAACLPEHCNINRIELMPTRQAPGAHAVDRD